MLEETSFAMLALPDDIIIQALPELDQYYAFNIENGDHFRLNSAAYWVLETIGRKVSLASLKAEFASAFGLSHQEAERDLNEVLRFAKENNIIKED